MRRRAPSRDWDDSARPGRMGSDVQASRSSLGLDSANWTRWSRIRCRSVFANAVASLPEMPAVASTVSWSSSVSGEIIKGRTGASLNAARAWEARKPHAFRICGDVEAKAARDFASRKDAALDSRSSGSWEREGGSAPYVRETESGCRGWCADAVRIVRLSRFRVIPRQRSADISIVRSSYVARRVRGKGKRIAPL